jgi:hypothetical protein
VINLLPPSYAGRIKFGRQNTVLRRWIIAALAALGGLLVIIAGGWLYMNSQASGLQAEDAADISGDIRVINQVLNNEVHFSGLIQDIGTIMPPGSVLSTLSLSKINGALDLSTGSKDYASAAQIAVNLNDPANGLFSKVDIVSISCNNDTSNPYKCSGNFKALFSNTAQKKYLSVPQGGKQ